MAIQKLNYTQKAAAHRVKERRAKVSELYKQRYNQREIAEIIGNIDQSAISRDIKAIHKEWLSQAIDNVHVVRIRELADLERMEQECIDRLNRLKHNPHQGSRWMEERRKIKERRSRMLGLDTAQRYVVRKEVTIIDKAKRDEVILAALGNRLPQGVTAEDIKNGLDKLDDIQNAEYQESEDN